MIELDLGMWDAERTSAQLLDELATATEHAVEPLPAARGGLVVVRIPVPDEPPNENWRPTVDHAAELVRDIRPALATLAVEEPPDALPDPDWRPASALFRAGWVDLAALDPDRRAAFEHLRDSGFGYDWTGGMWWSALPALNIEPEPESVPPIALAAAVYEAWTGRTAPRPRPPLPEPKDPAQLWFWASDGDMTALLDRVRGALPDHLSWIAPGEDGWQPIIVQPTRARSAEEMLADLHAAIPVAGASWAAYQPNGGLAVPGFDPELPATGVLVHPWVRRNWIGAELDGLDRVLAGSRRTEIGAGVFYNTETLASGEEARWRRLVEAAAILGRVARHSWIG